MIYGSFCQIPFELLKDMIFQIPFVPLIRINYPYPNVALATSGALRLDCGLCEKGLPHGICCLFLIWMFPKIGGTPPKCMVYNMENPMNKWMTWGYHYFWKHPYKLLEFVLSRMFVKSLYKSLDILSKFRLTFFCSFGIIDISLYTYIIYLTYLFELSCALL